MNGQDDDPELPDDDQDEPRAAPPGSTLGDFGAQYSQVFSNLYSSGLKNFLAGLPSAGNWFPQIQFPRLLLPEMKFPTLRIDPAALGIGKSLANIVQTQQAAFGPITALLAQQHKQWDSLFRSLQELTESLFPANWKGVRHPKLHVIEVIVLDEGIPLAWIPSPGVLQTVFDAPDAAKRRQVIGRRWKRVVSDCEGVLSDVTHVGLQCYQPFAADIIRALREGHVSAAQALAANLLDSILRRNFDKESFKEVTTNKKGDRFDLDAYQIRTAFTLAPIWRAYAQYWEHQGDPIPRTFGRHPSAHAVSRTQYSRINAVIALMLVTSLLKLLDWELVP